MSTHPTAPTSTDRVLAELPRMGAAFWRGVLPRPPRPPAVADYRVIVRGHAPDVDALARYVEVCGFTLRDALPPTWLHVLTFGLQIHLLADPATTLPLAGLVHVSNRMRLYRPVLLTERLDLSCEIGNLRPHRRGTLVDLTGEVRVGSALVWQGVSSYLARGVQVPGDPGKATDDPPGTVPGGSLARWHLPADLGRRYRAVAGDPNPIHTSRLAARAFGFPSPIAHGMWTHARVLAALENRLPAAYRVSVEFTKPILLPSSVDFTATATDGGWQAAVTSGDRPHLLAEVELG